MPTLLESVSRLTDCAKKLRTIADELNTVEVKSEIVDQIILIQEIREEILTHGEDSGMLRAEPAAAPASANSKLNANVGLVRVEPPKESETYGFVKEPDPEPEPPAPEPSAQPTPESAEGGEATHEKPAEGEESSKKAEPEAEAKASVETEEKPTDEKDEAESPEATPPDDGMTPEQRAALAEMRISELEPLQQAVLKRMNDILTVEQKKKKSANTKVGQKKGLAGRELQQFVISSLELSDEQQHRMVVSRKELHDIRVEIKKHVANLLTDEQRAAIDSKAE